MRLLVLLLALLLTALAAPPASAARDPRVKQLVTLREEALALQKSGRYAEAKARIEQAMEIGRTIKGRAPLADFMLREDLAYIHLHEGRFDAAEAELRAALEARARYGKPNDPEIAVPMTALATSLLRQGKREQAIALFAELVAIDSRAKGRNSVEAARSLSNLGSAQASAGLDKEAEDSLRRAYDIAMSQRRRDSGTLQLVANVSNNLAALYKGQHRDGDAEPLYKASVDAWTQLAGPDAPGTLLAKSNLGVFYRDLGKLDLAKPLLDTVLDRRLELLGTQSPDVALAANNLGWLHVAQDDYAYAAQLFSASMGTYLDLRRVQSGAALAGKGTAGVSLSELSRPVSGLIVSALHVAPDAPTEQQAAIRDAAFEAAQWMSQGEAATALARSAARFAAGTGELAGLVRHQQDLAAEWTELDAAVTGALADPRARNAPQVAGARKRLAEIDHALEELGGTLAQRFPDYAALADPQPLAIAEVRRWMQPDEALVFYALFQQRDVGSAFVWVVTKDDMMWSELALKPAQMAGVVAQLRCGLDYGALADGEACARFGADPATQTLAPFDAELAYQLYQSILGPAAGLIKDRKLLVVAPEPLAALPFQVLVTDPPAVKRPQTGAELKATSFLGHSNAISVLPSVATLRLMRANSRASAAPDAYLGFGDPVLDGTRSCPPAFPEPEACPRLSASEAPRASEAMTPQRRAALSTRAIASRTAPATRAPTRIALAGGAPAGGARAAGGLAEVDAVRLLCPLADTATEIRCVGGSLGAPPAAMHIGADASETALKAAALDRYRVLHFATHGLLARDVRQMSDGLAEPALVLTPPAQASARDDGLLTASEIAALKLDADWVILSACDTAAGGGDEGAGGGETLSGLARAFLYAGSRALLVSHWPVTSSAAVELTTAAFDALRTDPAIGRAEAMRRAMGALIDTGDDVLAHPSYWAPFSVIGEGDAPLR